MEAEVNAGQGTYRTNVNHIHRIWTIEFHSGKCLNGDMVTALYESKCGLLGNFIGKANATGTGNATLAVEQYIGSQRNALIFMIFLFNESGFSIGMHESIFLQLALTCFIANRTVQWMIDEQELHNCMLGMLGSLTFSVNHHAISNRSCACNAEFWTPLNGNFTIRIYLRLAIWTLFGESDIDQTHSAVSGNT